MSSRAVASQRCRWLDFCQWSTFAQRSSTSLIDRLETVRRLQRPTQHPVQPEARQRQGLVQSFRQTAGCGLVAVLQLTMERLERTQRASVYTGRLEALAPYSLLTLGQVPHHVLARVPLAAVDQGPIPEGVPDG